jgi:tetratricopeptide (TPR) repeat protein
MRAATKRGVVTRRRASLALSGAALLAGALWLWRTAGEPTAGYVELGSTRKHVRTDAQGETHVWTLSKQQLPLDTLEDRVLPQPAALPRAAEEADEASRTLDGLALAAWDHGEIRRAVALFERAIAADPGDPLPRRHYGRLLLLAEDYAHALPQLERAAELRPEDAQVWLDLQTLYERSLLLERAYYARRRARALADAEPITKDARGFYRLENDRFP